MSETSEVSTDDVNVVKDSLQKRVLGREKRRIIGPLMVINALLLISLAFWLYIDHDATTRSTTYLTASAGGHLPGANLFLTLPTIRNLLHQKRQ